MGAAKNFTDLKLDSKTFPNSVSGISKESLHVDPHIAHLIT